MEAFEVGNGQHSEQVSETGFVLDQDGYVPAFLVIFLSQVGDDVEFSSQNRDDPLLLAGLLKLEQAICVSVVRAGKMSLTQLGGPGGVLNSRAIPVE